MYRPNDIYTVFVKRLLLSYKLLVSFIKYMHLYFAGSRQINT